ncbi:MAG TPA: hypothetical protein VF808_13970 [Ktedonobacterales bacterium]
MTSPEYERRARQFEIDRITARYAQEAESGRNPDPKVYLSQYPQYATELADFIATYHLALADLPAPDETPAVELSPAFARALAAIPTTEGGPSPVALVGLEDRAFDVGSTPEVVAQKVGLSQRLLARLDAHAIAAATIPRELFRRLAEALDVSEQAVMAHLGASPRVGGAFFDADQAPTGAQEDFLSAIEASDLNPQRKAEWRALSARDAQEGQP